MRAPTIDIDAKVIESPCTVPWESMSGDEVKRFCGQCRLHVHDVSQMTRAEANALLRETNGSCCLRIWRRPDGRVITKDCGRMVRALRRRMQAVGAAAAALLALVGLGGCSPPRAACCEAGANGKPAAPPPVAPPPKPPVPDATVTTGR